MPLPDQAQPRTIAGPFAIVLPSSGFVISDWQGINQIGPDYETDVKVGVNAGIDMVMVPDQYANFERALTAQRARRSSPHGAA